jgi:hypothetical protein
MSIEDERMQVLQMIEDGKITAEDGLRLLHALSGAGGGGAEQARAEAGGPPSPPEVGRWRNWWLIPLWAGLALAVLGGGLLYWAYHAGGSPVWFACAGLPFALGMVVAGLAWASRASRWIHVRVNTGQAKWPQKIALSFPLPIRLAAWGLRVAGRFIPRLQRTGVDELILALDEGTSPENPLFVDVHEGDGEERVQVYIG